VTKRSETGSMVDWAMLAARRSALAAPCVLAAAYGNRTHSFRLKSRSKFNAFTVGFVSSCIVLGIGGRRPGESRHDTGRNMARNPSGHAFMPRPCGHRHSPRWSSGSKLRVRSTRYAAIALVITALCMLPGDT
jgi:hypothetical protein